MSNGDIEHFLEIQEKLNKNIQIYFGQRLNQLKTIHENTLIIHDESHYGQSKQQTLNKCFKKLGLSGILSGDFRVLRQKGIRYISVSATPFSELNMNVTDSQGKKIIMGTPGDTYIGVGKLLEKGKIYFEAIPVTEQYKFELSAIFLQNIPKLTSTLSLELVKPEKQRHLFAILQEFLDLNTLVYLADLIVGLTFYRKHRRIPLLFIFLVKQEWVINW